MRDSRVKRSKLSVSTWIAALVAGLLVAVPGQPAAAQNAACNFAVGDGSSATPYQVATLADLQQVRACHGSATGIFFEQTAHIDISAETNWTPIGNGSFVFNDHYNGNFFEIRNLTINATATASPSYFGLFGRTDGFTTSADIKSIALTNVDIDVAAAGFEVYVGAVAGEAAVWSSSETFRVDGSIDVTGTAVAGSAVGGGFGVNLVNSGREVGNVMFTGTINSTAEYTGGAIGYVQRMNSTNFDFRNLNVRGSVSGAEHTGGLIGGITNQTSATQSNIADGFLDASIQSANQPDNRIIGVVFNDSVGLVSHRTVTDALTGALDISGIGSQSLTSTITRSALPNLSSSRWAEINDGYTTDLTDSKGFIRCNEINNGYPVSFKWFTPLFTTDGTGPCQLAETITNPVYFPGDRAKVVVTLTPATGYYAIGSSQISITSDLSGLFTSYPQLTGANEIGLDIAADLPAGVYPVTLQLDRPDIPLYTGRSFIVQAIGCDYQGSGTSADPYLVSTRDQLSMIAICSQGVATEFKLTQNLDLQGSVWNPVGTNNKPFSGIFDGGGFTISNLDVSGDLNSAFSRSGSDGAGLFGRINNAEIKNLNIEGDVHVLSSSDATGGLAGVIENAVVTGVSFTGSVLADDDDGSIGGIAGDGRFVDFEDVHVDVSIVGSEEASRAGGIVGDLQSASSIRNASATGEISLGGDFNQVGGIVGFSSGSVIMDVSVTDFILGGGDDVGGIAGDDVGGTIANFSVTDVTIEAFDDRVGGVVGDTTGDIYNGKVSGLSITITGGGGLRHGGIAGRSDGGVISRVSVAGEIYSEATAGGAIGDLISGEVSYVAAKVDLITIGNSVSRIGGFVGFQQGGSITDSYAIGTITDDNTASSTDPDPDEIGSFAGAILASIGSVGDDFITNSYAAVDVMLDIPATDIENAAFVGSFFANRDIVTSFLLGTDTTAPTCHAAPANCYDVTATDAETMSSLATFDTAGWTIQEGWAPFALFSDDPVPAAEAVWGLCSLVNDGLPFLMHEAGADPCVAAQSSPAPYTGPLVVNNQQQVVQGESTTITGQRLDQVSAILVAGVEATIDEQTENSITFTISVETALGVTDILLIGSFGNLTLQDALLVVEKETIQAVQDPAGWTKAQPDGTIKIYAKNVVAAGKVQFFQNGKEIAWVRAADETDPKLRRITEGPMAGTNYLVRTITLLPGKNALEINIEGERIWRAAYTRKD